MSLSESNRYVTSSDGILDALTGVSLVKCDRLPCTEFDCGHGALNAWFNSEVHLAESELMTQTYKLMPLPDDLEAPPIALVSICNDAVPIGDVREHFPELPEGQPFASWPAVRIARLAVAKEFQRGGVGTQTINLVKHFFVLNNRTGCRLLTLECSREVMPFYWRNEFEVLHHRDNGSGMRNMWFDLLRMRIPIESDGQ
jgi:GNAT superfamily N-acetyltransferase